MKTFLSITNGGRRTRLLVTAIMTILLFQSCCTASHLVFDNQKPKIDIATETGFASINCICYQGKYYYIGYELKGSYVINTDSLRLLLNDENLILHHPEPQNISISNGYKVKSNTTVKDCNVTVYIFYHRKDETKEIKNPLILSILPSDFITSNGKRILNDTLRVKLFNPMKK
ncbi:hypothetical protein [Prevotella koreensis]|uniref:hypothetical protein n=1 Tax=Prevotella koreensis TaxID=2490854 RepID=UPI0028E58677|nr:hypothetical protein [Prevotella koreensis]